MGTKSILGRTFPRWNWRNVTQEEAGREGPCSDETIKREGGGGGRRRVVVLGNAPGATQKQKERESGDGKKSTQLSSTYVKN